MRAEQLIIKTGMFDPGKLDELIDAHNALVRHIFAHEKVELKTFSGESTHLGPRMTAGLGRVRSQREIEDCHSWLVQLGVRCRCVFPKLKRPQPYIQVEWCLSCSKPYVEPLEND